MISHLQTYDLLSLLSLTSTSGITSRFRDQAGYLRWTSSRYSVWTGDSPPALFGSKDRRLESRPARGKVKWDEVVSQKWTSSLTSSSYAGPICAPVSLAGGLRVRSEGLWTEPAGHPNTNHWPSSPRILTLA